jgi:hypothetical protein
MSHRALAACTPRVQGSVRLGARDCAAAQAAGRGLEPTEVVPLQGAIYNWVNATALLRIDPASDAAQRMGSSVRNLKNKVMELRKARPSSLLMLMIRCAHVRERARRQLLLARFCAAWRL